MVRRPFKIEGKIAFVWGLVLRKPNIPIDPVDPALFDLIVRPHVFQQGCMKCLEAVIMLLVPGLIFLKPSPVIVLAEFGQERKGVRMDRWVHLAKVGVMNVE